MPLRIAFFSALAVILLRIVLYLTGNPPEGTAFMPVHLLALVLVPFFAGHVLLRKEPRVPFPAIMRVTFRSTALYAVLYGIFIWMYYKGIDATEFPMKINAMVEKAVADGGNETDVRAQLERFFTPFNYATITFFALLVIGAINSLIVSLLHHKVLRNLRR